MKYGASWWHTSNKWHSDTLGPWSEAEVVVEARSTAVELVAASVASGVVAEDDVRGRRQAVRVRSIEARRPAVVHGAVSAARVPRTRGAVHDHDVPASVRGRAVDEGDLSVGGGEPGEDVGRGRESLFRCGKLL